jgi:hypothetical protein
MSIRDLCRFFANDDQACDNRLLCARIGDEIILTEAFDEAARLRCRFQHVGR